MGSAHPLLLSSRQFQNTLYTNTPLCSYQYEWTGSENDCGLHFDCKDQTIFLQQDTIRGYYWPLYWTKHQHRNSPLKELTSSPLGAQQRKKPQPTFCISLKIWLCSNRHTRAPFFWTLRMLNSLILGDLWNFSKETGLPSLGIKLWTTKGPF
jgi:hypothetical protein